jgi:gliding motility-associated lipoprotein GldJ
MRKHGKLAGSLLLTAAMLLGATSCKLFKKKEQGFEFQIQKSTNVHRKGMISQVTGIPYNYEDTVNNVTSLVVNEYLGQPDGPNLVFIEGGRFVMGSGEEDILYTRDNKERTVSIQSFFMDRTEVANIHWLEFMHYYERPQNQGTIQEDFKLVLSPDYTSSYEEFRKRILLPDTTVWANDKAFNDSYVQNYLRYPGFRFFPVVGVSWVQAKAFCAWRTKAVNEYLFAEAKKKDKDGRLNEYKPGQVPLESGIVLPDYRLPTEAEWEYAAKGLIGTQYNDENQSNGRIYPWDGHSLRNPYGKQMGTFLANFKRGRGDYAGIAGRQNDGALITEWIYAYPPNDFGLYNMAGNVNEWVEDVYRPLAYEDFDDLNPVRRERLDSTRLRPDTTLSVYEDDEENYLVKKADGGKALNSLINDDVRVYKGGPWKDVAYWLSPGTRRFLDKNKSTNDIGFRCAMIMAGEKEGENRRKNETRKYRRK